MLKSWASRIHVIELLRNYTELNSSLRQLPGQNAEHACCAPSDAQQKACRTLASGPAVAFCSCALWTVPCEAVVLAEVGNMKSRYLFPRDSFSAGERASPQNSSPNHTVSITDRWWKAGGVSKGPETRAPHHAHSRGHRSSFGDLCAPHRKPRGHQRDDSCEQGMYRVTQTRLNWDHHVVRAKSAQTSFLNWGSLSR